MESIILRNVAERWRKIPLWHFLFADTLICSEKRERLPTTSWSTRIFQWHLFGKDRSTQQREPENRFNWMFTRGATWTIWIRLLDHMHSGASSARRKKILERRNSEEINPNPKFFPSSHFKASSYHLNLGRLRPGNPRPNWANALCKRLLLHDYYIMCPECQPCSIYQPIKDKIVHWSHLKNIKNK